MNYIDVQTTLLFDLTGTGLVQKHEVEITVITDQEDDWHVHMVDFYDEGITLKAGVVGYDRVVTAVNSQCREAIGEEVYEHYNYSGDEPWVPCDWFAGGFAENH